MSLHRTSIQASTSPSSKFRVPESTLEVYARLKRSCDMHKCRNLSVHGRATVLNTLLLSKIWHVLRVTWIPKETLDKITSIGRQFVQHHQFPYISCNVLLQPTQRGDLGLLDPAIQQSLLAYR
ncbi:hypothetical protein BCV72DRAFT_338070 [Rhizopus microsporus var. microsporus]|uniref:Uncharacterized protein n=2 Tax=Rhizopus microsporus TaxID=58291 RepID=A0A2G4SJD5_RHIZD|nr:uncharacterized protein RHIMIDRAFT_294706 [Rhizopus microsporus ATCC 52813]ORE03287.1 hypothetical protein BCV72DRAFT_338070 [Rhizopus microsporus var. microsporus]PHZ08862.1 hypothetical protein RHIMIDRAFT_294706 [Rhizopus microsporus ATCC 52813]